MERSTERTGSQTDNVAPAFYSAADLYAADLPEINYVVRPILAEGVAILSAKPKLGKSWFALQLCLAVTSGSSFLGFPTQRGRAIYFDFENAKSIQKDRLLKQLNGQQPPDDLFFISENVPRIGGGFEEYLVKVLEQIGGVRLVVVDVYKFIQGQKRATESEYEQVYRDIACLKEFAKALHLSVILITHNRKLVDESDPFADVLGSTGLMGASDQAMVIYKKERKATEATLSITGRSVPPNDLVISFDKASCTWKMEGELEDYEYRKDVEAYKRDPVVATIRKAVALNGGSWKGKVGDLISASQYYRTPIHLNEQSLGRKMPKLIRDLFLYDRIAATCTMTGGSRTYHFTVEGNPFDEDTPA